MNRYAYYDGLKALAREIRVQFEIDSPKVRRSDLRAIYKEYGIKIDLRPLKSSKLRGAYFNDEHGVSVLINKKLPDAPFIFTMAHELKHHLKDQDREVVICDLSFQNDAIEIGAEIFAAELIFPENDFIDWMEKLGIDYGECSAEDVVRLKRDSETTMSYAGLVKRVYFLGFAETDAFKGTKWTKLEESMYGEPIYKRINRHRKRSAAKR